MMISSLKFHVLLLILISTSTNCATQQISNVQIAKPNCTDRCGSISIPFPFGTREGCYADPLLRVNCFDSSGPPTLFLDNSTDGTTQLQILNISLDGQLTVMGPMVKTCNASEPTPTANMSLPNLFSVNITSNKFFMIGCNSLGIFLGTQTYIHTEDMRYQFTGCAATCSSQASLKDDSCSGSGCCQADVPKQVQDFAFSTNPAQELGNFSGNRPCIYGFVADNSTFKYSPDNLANVRDVESLPMVVDWTIENVTCDSVCITPNSECYELPNTDAVGQRCRCKAGYEGNPYLTGCQDINECRLPELNNCIPKQQRCKNTPGNFTCECEKGYKGDGTGGGCTRRQSQTDKLIAVGALAFIVVMMVMFLAYFVHNKRRLKMRKDMHFIQNGGMMLQEKLRAAGGRERKSNDNDHMAKIFSSIELQHATNNFHKSMVIGQGGFGTVYKGLLENNSVVAIKKSKEVDRDQIEQFVNEFMVLSQINHRNVVRLIGCCLDTEVPLLVYEFVNNGTLYEHIHNQAKKGFLDWKLRLKIATETADVLSYLHSAAATPIIHRDVKSANILLDHEFKARVADFGASRLVPMDETQLPTMVLGTLGYLDPEYMQTQELTEKSDVYSFGVVLVELITGKKVINYSSPEKEKSLSSFFLWKLKQGCLYDVLDETMNLNEKQKQQIIGVAKLAQVCINVRGEDRPSMKEVAMELESIRSGGKRSWAKQEENMEYDVKSFSGKGFDGFVDVDGDCATSMNIDTLKDHTILRGGR